MMGLDAVYLYIQHHQFRLIWRLYERRMKVIIIIRNDEDDDEDVDNDDGSYLFFALVILAKSVGVRNK